MLESIAYLVNIQGRNDIQFVLVGGGPSLENLKSLSVEMGLQDYVTFTGRAPDKELFEILSNADVCVNPDKVNEMNDKSTMNKILEYMAFEKPIVQFDVTEGRFFLPGLPASMLKRMTSWILQTRSPPFLMSRNAGRKWASLVRYRVETEMAWPYQIPALIGAYKDALRMP